MRHSLRRVGLVLCGLALQVACSHEEHRTVRATAYNSTRAQTDSRPTESSCGDKLRPGNKVIAVSRDLARAGLECGTRVQIKGLEGEYKVVDLTAARHRQLIDIYMGRNVRAARKWGSQDVEITWVE
jgi:3D (Asp-Asp-Asp) domain-containing protein